MQTMSRLGMLYNQIYSLIGGQHPHFRPWHFQWLAGKDLYTVSNASYRSALAGF